MNRQIFPTLLLWTGYSLLFTVLEYFLLSYQDKKAERFAGENCEKFSFRANFTKEKIFFFTFGGNILILIIFAVAMNFFSSSGFDRDSFPPVFVLAMNLLSIVFGWKNTAIWFGRRGVTGGGLPDIRWDEIEKISFDMDKGQNGWYYYVHLRNKKVVRAMIPREKKQALEEKFSFYLEKFSSVKEKLESKNI